MTRQEMFDLAFRGLRSQGFRRCEDGGTCIYDDRRGKHCAWGWVDPIPKHERTGINGLRQMKLGVAATLSEDDAHWASCLQECHDESLHDIGMENRLRAFAAQHGLNNPNYPYRFQIRPEHLIPMEP